jgi:membrane dipeptidase
VDHPRCITDEAAKAIAARGGVIGVHFGSLFNNPKYWEWQKANNPIKQQPVPQPATPRIFNEQVTLKALKR